MIVRVNNKRYRHDLTIDQFRQLTVDKEVIPLLKEIIPEDEFKAITQKDMSKISIDMDEDIKKADKQKAPEFEWNGYSFPKSMDDTTIEQEFDFKSLCKMKEQELRDQGSPIDDWHIYPLALAVFFRKEGEPYSSEDLFERSEMFKKAPVKAAIAWIDFFTRASEDTRSNFVHYFPSLLRLAAQKAQQKLNDSTSDTSKIISLQQPPITSTIS